jgi:hypothetical protein
MFTMKKCPRAVPDVERVSVSPNLATVGLSLVMKQWDAVRTVSQPIRVPPHMICINKYPILYQLVRKQSDAERTVYQPIGIPTHTKK